MDDKMDGFSTAWHENGQKKAEANWKDSKRDGLSTEWHENGQKKSESNWKDGCADGLANTWYKNGQKKAEANWEEDKIVWLLSWHENGEKSAESNFKNGNGGLGLVQRGRHGKLSRSIQGRRKSRRLTLVRLKLHSLLVQQIPSRFLTMVKIGVWVQG